MDLVNQWAEELDMLHQILNKTILKPETKWGTSVYTYKGRNIVTFGGFKKFFTLWFYDGVFLSDPYQVLLNANEEKTKALRQWRFTHSDQIDEKKILSYINEAIKNVEDGKIWKAQKTEQASIPEQLENLLQQDKSLATAFEQLSTYKQNEYIEYISTAKKEETKMSRLAKITPMILAGKGLNDKYKN